MIEQLLQQLRRGIERSDPDRSLSEQGSAALVLLLLVWAHHKRAYAWSNLDLSPLQLINELREFASVHPVLEQFFIKEGVLDRIKPVSLTMALDTALQLAQEPGQLTHLVNVADLPRQLGVMFAFEPSLAVLIAKLVHPNTNERVYVPWDSTGQIGAALADLGAKVTVVNHVPSAIPLLLGLLYEGQWRVRQANPLHEAYGGRAADSDETYAAAAALLPVGMRIDLEDTTKFPSDVYPERTSSVAVLGIRQLLASTRGRIVVAVTNNVLFSPGAEYSLRADLVRTGQLRAVIGLPVGLLVNAAVYLNLLVIDPQGGNQYVTFINADSPRYRKSLSRTRAALVNLEELVQMTDGASLFPEVAHVSRLVSRDEMLENDVQLQVSRYVVSESILQLQKKLKKSPQRVLEDFFTLVRPPTLISDKGGDRSDEVEADDSLVAYEVGAADLPAYGYITRAGRKVRLDPKAKPSDQFLRAYDILLIVKGSVGKVGIVAPSPDLLENRRWVAGQSAMVLRVRDAERIDPRSFFMLLRSPIGQELLKGVVSGATIQLIQLKELRKLTVFMPEEHERARAAALLEEEARIEQQINELQSQQADLAKNLWLMDDLINFF